MLLFEPWRMLVLYSGWGMLSLLTGTPGGGCWSLNSRVHSTPATTLGVCITAKRFILAKHVVYDLNENNAPPPPGKPYPKPLFTDPSTIITINTPEPKCRLYWCLIVLGGRGLLTLISLTMKSDLHFSRTKLQAWPMIMGHINDFKLLKL